MMTSSRPTWMAPWTLNEQRAFIVICDTLGPELDPRGEIFKTTSFYHVTSTSDETRNYI